MTTPTSATSSYWFHAKRKTTTAAAGTITAQMTQWLRQTSRPSPPVPRQAHKARILRLQQVSLLRGEQDWLTDLGPRRNEKIIALVHDVSARGACRNRAATPS
jgi:hypothetical protein